MKWMTLWSRLGLASLMAALVLLVVQSLSWMHRGAGLDLKALQPVTRLVPAVDFRSATLPTPWPALNELILSFGTLWVVLGVLLLAWQGVWLALRRHAARQAGAAPPWLPAARQDAAIRFTGRVLLGVVLLGVALATLLGEAQAVRQPREWRDALTPAMAPLGLAAVQLAATLFLMFGQKLRGAAWVCLLATLPQLLLHPLRAAGPGARVESSMTLFIAQLGLLAGLLLLLGSLPRTPPPAKPGGTPPPPKPAAAH